MRSLFLTMCSLFLFTHSCYANVTVKEVTYKGWPNSYLLTNGTVNLVLVPSIGRIMYYGEANGPNTLWNNPAMLGRPAPVDAAANWPNFGGDKLWPSPQSVWNWPPDPLLDSAPLKVKVTAQHELLATGQPSPKSGIRFERLISMNPVTGAVTLRNTMTNISGAPVHWGIWEVFQANSPLLVIAPLSPPAKFARGYFSFYAKNPPLATVRHAKLMLRRNTKSNWKIGIYAAHSLLQVKYAGRHETTLSLWHSVNGAGRYPDGGCTLEVYSSPDPLNYMEMELMGPMITLQPGGRAVMITHWRLHFFKNR